MTIQLLRPDPETKRSSETPKHIRQLLLAIDAKLLATEIKIRAPAPRLSQIIAARIKGSVYLLQRLVQCGKHCKKCPHGPYWYGYYRSKGRFVSFYIGKQLPRRFIDAERIHLPQPKEDTQHGHNPTDGPT